MHSTRATRDAFREGLGQKGARIRSAVAKKAIAQLLDDVDEVRLREDGLAAAARQLVETLERAGEGRSPAALFVLAGLRSALREHARAAADDAAPRPARRAIASRKVR